MINARTIAIVRGCRRHGLSLGVCSSVPGRACDVMHDYVGNTTLLCMGWLGSNGLVGYVKVGLGF